MEEQTLAAPACPLALQERDCKDVSSCVLSNNNEGYGVSEQNSSSVKGPLVPSETQENGSMQFNGKPHSHLPNLSEVDSYENTSFDALSVGKKLNGLIHSECGLSDDRIVKTIQVVNEDSKNVCHVDSTHIPKTVTTQNCSSNCPSSKEEKKYCISEESNTQSHDVDALLRKLEDVSLAPSLDTSNISECENGSNKNVDRHGIEYVVYESERQMPDIMRLITKDLSEPYSIYTYRYFIHNWPRLCFLAKADDQCVGAIVCKLDLHKKMARRGYIAMLAVDSEYRRRQIGSTLVTKAIEAMIKDDCDEVVLETEITNQGALRLYENLGFVRDKRLFRYYLNGVDALRLKLWLR